MKIKAYICPSCGAPLNVNHDTTFTFCPNCGNRLHISYEGEAAPKKPDLRQFTESDTGTALASVFGTHLQEEKAKLLAFFNTHAINIMCALKCPTWSAKGS